MFLFVFFFGSDRFGCAAATLIVKIKIYSFAKYDGYNYNNECAFKQNDKELSNFSSGGIFSEFNVSHGHKHKHKFNDLSVYDYSNHFSKQLFSFFFPPLNTIIRMEIKEFLKQLDKIQKCAKIILEPASPWSMNYLPEATLGSFYGQYRLIHFRNSRKKLGKH